MAAENMAMRFDDWFPLAVVGGTFFLLGCVKLFGLIAGIEGGRNVPFSQKLCGT
ncbi:MAG: hypothetical protein ACRD3E_08705 [Terriglobales bacterium]